MNGVEAATPGSGVSKGNTQVARTETVEQSGDIDCRNLAPSGGPVPHDVLQKCGKPGSQEALPHAAAGLLVGELGPILIQETVNENMYTTSLPGFKTFTSFGPIVPDPSTDYPADIELLPTDTTHLYQLTSHGAVSRYDTAGANTPLSTIAPPVAGQVWMEMATDPTTGIVYGVSVSCGSTSRLSTLNLTAGTSSSVGTITNSPCLIGMAFTNAGNLYGYDVVNDSLLSIDKATGAGTIVGPIGFNANFNQSMDCDPDTGICYMFAFNATTFRAELRRVNLATGATTFLGVLGSISPGGTVEASGAVFGTIGAACNPSSPPPTTVNPGIDLFSTPSTGATYDDFGCPTCMPIPPGFFGPGSNAFAGRINFKGTPLNPPTLGLTDTIVKRNAAAILTGPGSSATIPIQMVALSLESIAPITVTYSASPSELWDVKTCLSNAVPQSIGSMTITAGPCQGQGGTFTSTLLVSPRLVFRRQSDGVIRTLDPVAMGAPPVDFAGRNGHWVETPDAALTLTTVAPGLTVDHDCDPATAPIGPLPGTSNFFPGVRSGMQSGLSGLVVNCGPQKKRLTAEEALTYAVGHYPLPAQGPMADADNDGIVNDADNCTALSGPSTYNPLQEDADDDGIGDLCDTCPTIASCNNADADHDGIGDICDNCPQRAGSNQTDTDGDGYGDVCDVCPAIVNPGQADADHDGRGDLCDNCLTTPNTDQVDFDHDGEGDACDMNDGQTIITTFTNSCITWSAETSSTYNLYRGSLSRLFTTGEYTQNPSVEPEAARFCGLTGTGYCDSHNPPIGRANHYLITVFVTGVGEGSLGLRSNGNTRPNANPCP